MSRGTEAEVEKQPPSLEAINTHRFDIVVENSCLDEYLDRLVTRRAFLINLDVGADVSITTCLLYQSCSRTVVGKDSLGMSALVSVSVEVTHFYAVMSSQNADRRMV